MKRLLDKLKKLDFGTWKTIDSFLRVEIVPLGRDDREWFFSRSIVQTAIQDAVSARDGWLLFVSCHTRDVTDYRWYATVEYCGTDNDQSVCIMSCSSVSEALLTAYVAALESIE